jgi:hypothetical protein
MKTHNRLRSLHEFVHVKSAIMEPPPSREWAAFDEALDAIASAGVAKKVIWANERSRASAHGFAAPPPRNRDVPTILERSPTECDEI